MPLQYYLRLARRNLLLLVLAPVLLGLVAFLLSASRTDRFRSSSLVLLHPNDPNENLDSAGAAQNRFVDLAAFAQSQLEVLGSPAVTRRAADAVAGSTVEQIRDARSFSVLRNSTVLKISCESQDRVFVVRCADALATGYIESRRLAAVAGLQSALDSVNSELTAVQAELATLAQKAETDRRSRSLSPSSPTPVAIDPTLQAAIDSTSERYKSLADRQSGLGINIKLKRGEAEVVSEAVAPIGRVSPSPARDGLVGVAVGLLLAFVIAVIRDQLDTKLSGSEDLESATNLPVLTQLPVNDDVVADPTYLPMLSDPFSPFAERVRELRTSLQFRGTNAELRTIVITSSEPGEGKSIVCANLAASLAQAGSRVLVMSGDLRRPRIESLLGSGRDGLGLSDLISLIVRGNGGLGVNVAVALADSAQPSLIENLSILPAGSRPPNPNELLSSAPMRAIMVAAKDLYDFVLVDSPPLEAVADAVAIGSLTDGAVVVATARLTDRRMVKRSVDLLQSSGVRVVGTVLNRDESRRGTYSYRYDDAATPGKSGRFSRWRRRSSAKRSRPAKRVSAPGYHTEFRPPPKFEGVSDLPSPAPSFTESAESVARP